MAQRSLAVAAAVQAVRKCTRDRVSFTTAGQFAVVAECVKTAVLCAHELVPEAYRQRFRNHEKRLGKTFVEFAREKRIAV